MFSIVMKNTSKNIHASLFSTGSWETNGCYYDDEGKYAWAEGQTQIFHRAKHWYAKNSLQLSGSRTMESSYEVEASGTDKANWTSRDSLLHELTAMAIVMAKTQPRRFVNSLQATARG